MTDDNNRKTRFLRFVSCPPVWFVAVWCFVTLLLAAASVVAVILIEETNAACIVLYAVAALFLAYAVYAVVRTAPDGARRVAGRLRENKVTGALIGDYGKRTVALAVLSLVVNVAFAAMNWVNAVINDAIWYRAITGYYVVLIIIRVVVVVAGSVSKKKYRSEDVSSYRAGLKVYLVCGAMLSVLEVAIIVAIIQMVASKRPIEGDGIYAIITAAYAFYKAIMAAVNFVKARRYGDPIVQSLRNINIADAWISIVSLTVMMIAVFGDGDADDPSMKAVKAFVGFGAVAIVTAMSLIMVIKAVKRLRIKEADRHELRKDECDICEEE